MSFLQSVFQAICQIVLAMLLCAHTAWAARHKDVSPDMDARATQPAMRAPDLGYWHTNEAQILDSWNRPVRIQGINWYGFETRREVAGGLTVQDYRVILDTVKREGYNTIRLPFSNQMVEDPIVPAVPNDIAFGGSNGPINQDLRGLNSLQIMDKIVDYAGKIGLKVILDDHRSEAGDSAEQNGLWYTEQYQEISWIADWVALATRYKSNSTVIGMDLRNEPHGAQTGGACWDCGGERDWHLAAERAGDAILKVNPKLLIFVEGTDAYHADATWWGGNLEGVKTSPVELTVANQLVYSPHLYGPKVYKQPWFNAKTTARSLEEVWHKQWAYISEWGIAPVWLGEFGTTNDPGDVENTAPGSEGQWFDSLVVYLSRNPDVGWAIWALNGEDADGLLNASYQFPVNGRKQQMMSSIMSTVSGQSQEVAGMEPLR